MGFAAKRQIIEASLVWDLGNNIKINFLGKILKICFTPLDRLVHFHVVSAVVDLGLLVNGMLHVLPALVLQWVVLTHRKQVIIYHIGGCKQIGLCFVVQLSYICNRDIVSADLFCLRRSRLSPRLWYSVMEKKSLKIMKLVPGLFCEWRGHQQ